MTAAVMDIFPADPAPSVWEPITGPSTDLDAAIIDAITTHGPLQMGQIMHRTGSSRALVNSRLQVLMSRGVVSRIGSHPGRYSLT